jgi:hypothetical protein
MRAPDVRAITARLRLVFGSVRELLEITARALHTLRVAHGALGRIQRIEHGGRGRSDRAGVLVMSVTSMQVLPNRVATVQPWHISEVV